MTFTPLNNSPYNSPLAEVDIKMTLKKNKKNMGELQVLRCLAEAFQDGVNVLKCFVDLCSHLGALKTNIINYVNIHPRLLYLKFYFTHTSEF